MHGSLALLTLLLCGTGCANNITPSSARVPLTKPQPGSWFTYDAHYVDRNGSLHNTDHLDGTDSIISAGDSAYGVTNLLRISTKPAGKYQKPDDRFIDYRDDGDLAIILANTSTAPYWMTYAIGSKQSIVYSEPEIDIDIPYRIPHRQMTYGGEERITVPAGTFDTRKIIGEMVIKPTNPDWDTMLRRDTTWIAPSIGYIVRRVDITYQESGLHGTVMELASYYLR